MNQGHFISLELYCEGILRFWAKDMPTQTALIRIENIASYILQHPKVTAIPFQIQLSGGLGEDGPFLIFDCATLERAIQAIRFIFPSSRDKHQGSSMEFTYLDAKKRILHDPIASDALQMYEDLTGHKIIPDRLIEHLDNLNT